MKKEKIIIFGQGVIAEVAHWYFTSDSSFEVAGFVNDDSFINGGKFFGCPLVPSSEVVSEFPPETHKIFIALGYKAMNSLRRERLEEFKEKGYSPGSYISSRAHILSDIIGEHCFILENNVIQPFAEIGANCTLWSGNHIGHHTRIGDNVFVSSHCVISGNCKVRENAFLGVNSTIGDGVEVGARSLIGAGAVVTKDLPERSVAKGAEGKVIQVKRDLL